MPGEFEGFDIEAASNSISADLGFGDDTGDELPGGESELAGQVDTTGGMGTKPAAPATPAAPVAPTPPADPNAPPAGTPAAPAPTGMAPPPSPADSLLNAPKTWKPEVAAMWQQLPEAVRAEVARREDNFYQGLEQYRGLAETGKSFQAAINEFLPVMQQYGVDPYQQVNALMRAHHTLALGTPEQKRSMLETLNRDYNLGLNFGEAPYVDPTVEALQRQVQELQSRTQRAESQQLAQRQAEVARQVEAFAADPQNVYFDECADQIALLVKQGVALPEAYKQAIWMNPNTRAKETARLLKEQSEAAEKAAREAAEKAKQAAGAKRVTQKAGGPTVPAGSIDETLSAALAEIKNRNN